MAASSRLREHIRCNVVGYVALFCFAIGGTATALPGRNTVDSGDIEPASVRKSDIANGAVTNAKIVNGAVDSSKIPGDAVGASEVAPNSLTAADIADTSSLGGSEIGENLLIAGGDLTGTVANAQIAANAVGSAEVGADSLTGADIDESTLSVGGTPTADGLGSLGLARATYDVAADGGGTGDHGLGVTLPDNAIVIGGVIDVITPFTSMGGATLELKVESAGDIQPSSPVALPPWSTAGEYTVDLSANPVKTSQARQITAVVANAALGAGKAIVFLEYVRSE